MTWDPSRSIIPGGFETPSTNAATLPMGIIPLKSTALQDILK